MKELHNVKTRNEFADFLKIPRKKLSYILYIKKVNNLYHSFEIYKKSGGIRKINAPTVELKDIQQKLAKALYKHQADKWNKKRNNLSHAFEKKKSIITNAKIHRNKRFVLNIDLENFFESFNFGRVRGFFIKNNHLLLPNEVATVIAQLSCYQGKLPQGAPSSPIITNLICEILDLRLLKIARRYKVDYTRYADDLTFSTNKNSFLEQETRFLEEISKELKRSGFEINEKKTRLQFKDSRQVVTGLVVNKKVNVKRDYYKNTRAMAHTLYTQGKFEIDGEEATIDQLEGRFSFINQLDWSNNMKINRNNKDYKNRFASFKSSEREYQKFLFYKYFYANSKPLIITEGKTDIAYLKSALKNLYSEYPDLITKKNDGTFEFKISFLKKSKRLNYFLDINKDGAEGLKKIYNLFCEKGDVRNYSKYFNKISDTFPNNPVILVYDNEPSNGKPLNQIINYAGLERETIRDKLMITIVDNLYLLTVPPVNEPSESDIEDLFDIKTLEHKINGKTFNKNNEMDPTKHYGKERFSQFISENYCDINFDNFKHILNNISDIVKEYKK
ncbi:RNA-directed DNA polymerase [Salibacterium salarium]|uniref:RNA-directed DNA polymerase n=1 Tax=Salibacterium salarium TaxID=284579 RepID=A0A428MU86_9BACI|nr:retron Ec67 family RNA-directed DNA polymerase/endonuclease [Salibacterium salarium]RSL29691.1 RNA-directed DNA polymerase [Salibacterium salarium]